jgi:Transposase, Mutator family
VAYRPIYLAIGVTVDGERDILGLWAGQGGEGAKYWAHVLTEIKNRGTKDVCILVCDGLTGLPEAVASVWPQTIVRPASRKVRDVARRGQCYVSSGVEILAEASPRREDPRSDLSGGRLTTQKIDHPRERG